MKQIRVLQVLDKISFNSGACAVVMNYYHHMDLENIVFDFLVHEDVPDDMRALILDKGSKIYVMPSLKMQNLVQYQVELNKLFESMERYDIIHGHIPNATFFYLRAAKKAGIKIRIIHSHNSKGAEILWKNIRNVILNKIGRFYANVYFACSKNAAKYMYNTDKNVYFLNNAIDVEKYKFDFSIRNRYRKELGIQNDEILLGHVGRFCEQKNHGFLLEILSELLKIDDRYKLLLIGDGHKREEIQQKAIALGIEKNILYTGVVGNAHDYYNAMDMFLLPSVFEGYPVVGVEAQCNGLMCMFSDKITRDTKILSNVEYLSIEDSRLWSDKILSANIKREETAVKKVIDAGYSIKEEAKKLQNQYIEFCKMNI